MNMSPRVMKILIGLPGSGKTRYATEVMADEPDQWFRVNWDEMRGENYVYSRESENRIKQESENLVRDIVARTNKNIIIDNTNLNRKTSDRWVNLARELGLRVELCGMPATVDECIRRDAFRTGRARVGRAVIERMALFADLIRFPTDKKIVLVDMDGTLSNLSHRLHYVRTEGQKKNWDEFFNRCLYDEPNEVIVKWVKAIAADPDFMVCIVSGRPIDKCGESTVAWLEKYGVPYDRLFMRNGGDKRDDVVVKKEILDKLPKNQIAFAIDDRPRVVRMWKENGVRVFAVADQSNDF